MFQNYGTTDPQKSKKSMTRMEKLQNYCQGRFPNFDINEIVMNDEDDDMIEIDIDTQQILITRNKDGNDLYRC